MKHKLYLIIGIFTLNCATKSAFLYEHPKKDGTGQKKAVYAEVEDMRPQPEPQSSSDRFKILPIDNIYETRIVDEIGLAIKSEMESTPVFESAELAAKPLTISNGKYTITSQLLKYEWGVENYKEMLNNTFMISLLTGGIGGIIYGSTKTTATGTVSVAFKVYDDRKKLFIDKTYSGNYSERLKKFSCDTPETKARVTAKALAEVMRQLKTDIR